MIATPLVVVSPHLDDAVLSCGTVIASHPGTTVVTVFAGSPSRYPVPPTSWDTAAGFRVGQDVMAIRREEDAAALRLLGGRGLWLDHLDRQYGPVDPAVLEADLRGCIEKLAPQTVLIPAGIRHPDHKLLAKVSAKSLVAGPWRLIAYVDLPYGYANRLATAVVELKLRALGAEPLEVHAAGDEVRKCRALGQYASQVRVDPKWFALAERRERYWRLPE